MLDNDYAFTVTERFLRYVEIDTQSNPHTETSPSTEKQKDLSQLLVNELLQMGLQDAHTDQFGYVYATIPSNVAKQVPVICFCSHVDTSPDCSGAGVKPIIHTNYDGSDIVLPDDITQVIRLKDHIDLQYQLGNDLITASGTTLLGADNKAGVAEIMDAAHYLINHPDIKHGTVKLLFTPDEEIGRGTANVDLVKLGADFGYTIDGETLGSLEDETFSADAVKITIEGVSTHPGFAKGKMESAIKAAAEVLARLPKVSLSPETTEGKEGFIHPVGIEGIVEKATINFIIRDFAEAGLLQHEATLKQILDEVMLGFPNSIAKFEVFEQYRNMKEVLDEHPQVVKYALSAIERVGIQPKRMSIRGGTDGSRLSFMGLPCPNIFAGEHAFHSKHEWVSVQDMQKAVAVIVEVCKVWEENTVE